MNKKIFNFSNTYAQLPKNFYEEIDPKPVKNPKLVDLNYELSRFLNIDSKLINENNGKLIFSGNYIPKGAKPIAMAYAGHQFGNYVPQLGDGRAILIGELIAKDGKRYDLQLKGSGRTSFSRQGDGRSPIGPVIREYVVSEALHYLGIKTTRSLAIVSSGEKVLRETLIEGGILTRVASSHIRIGTFEFFYYNNDFKSLKKLADYTIKRHFPELKVKNKYKFLLSNVINSQAELIAKWMSVGFIHGVMNTDNTSISGETIDYGPCAFMDHYDPNRVFSYIDNFGRYSYINQGKIMLWNLSKFAESLVPLLDSDFEVSKVIATNCLKKFPEKFEYLWLKEVRKKFGLRKNKIEDEKIINDFFEIIKAENLDFTMSFRNLSKIVRNEKCQFLNNNSKNIGIFNEWVKNWKVRIESENLEKNKIANEMDLVNPIYIPRNHLVEDIIDSAVNNNDFEKMKVLLNILRKPFSEEKNYSKFSSPPTPDEIIGHTFCGT